MGFVWLKYLWSYDDGNIMIRMVETTCRSTACDYGNVILIVWWRLKVLPAIIENWDSWGGFIPVMNGNMDDYYYICVLAAGPDDNTRNKCGLRNVE